MKFDFVKDCLLFGKRQFIVLGVITWLAIVCMLIDTVWTCILINQYLNLKP